MSEYQSSFVINPTLEQSHDSKSEINYRDLIVLHLDGRVPKTLNVFIIYRKLFVETALLVVITYYLQWHLVHGNKNLMKDQWKTISFDKPSTRKVKTPKPMKIVNKPTKHQQLDSPVSTPELLSDSPELSTTSSSNSSPSINNFDFDLEISFAQYLDLPIQADQEFNNNNINNLLLT
ncbi:11853_t:CDS:2, partial [Scutellospora calospora]